METNITTLTVRICGSIETPPATNREVFRQSVIDTVLHVMKTQEISIEYIGYQPDRTGIHNLESTKAEFEDLVYVSFNIDGTASKHFGNLRTTSKDDLIETFVEVFQNKTHRHLEIDSTFVKKDQRQRIIEMSSDWKFYLNHV